MKTKIIGVSGRARAGKDTFANNLKRVIDDECPNFIVYRYAFADQIKRELDELFIPKFGKSLFDVEGEEKEAYCHTLIGYGTTMRLLTENRHWWETLEQKILQDNPDFAIISDVRFAENENDEVSWIKRNQGKLVHVNRFTINEGKKKPVPFRSKDERKNEPFLVDAADYRINWRTEKDKDKLGRLATKEARNFYLENINYFLT